MVEALNAVLPIFVYILLIGLLVVGIILGIKLIITIDKVNNIMDDVEEKIESLNGLFRIINGVSDKFNFLSSKIADTVVSLISKLGNHGKRKDDDDYE